MYTKVVRTIGYLRVLRRFAARWRYFFVAGPNIWGGSNPCPLFWSVENNRAKMGGQWPPFPPENIVSGFFLGNHILPQPRQNKGGVPAPRLSQVQAGMARVRSDIVRRNGWRGLYRGFWITIARVLPVNGIIFLTYKMTSEALGRAQC